MYYQVGWFTPLSSMSVMTGRAVIMQLSGFSLCFSHVVILAVHADGCYSILLLFLFCKKKELLSFFKVCPLKQSVSSFICAAALIVASKTVCNLSWLVFRLKLTWTMHRIIFSNQPLYFTSYCYLVQFWRKKKLLLWCQTTIFFILTKIEDIKWSKERRNEISPFPSSHPFV